MINLKYDKFQIYAQFSTEIGRDIRVELYGQFFLEQIQYEFSRFILYINRYRYLINGIISIFFRNFNYILARKFA